MASDARGSDARPTRGRQGRIQQLPAALKDRLDALLRDGVSQKAILARLEPVFEEHGEKPISRSSLNRYATRMEAAGRRIREAREMAAVWTAKLGETPTSNVGAYTLEMLRTLVYDLTLKVNETADLDVEQLEAIALTLQRIERASKLNADRERALRRELAELAAAEAEKAAKAETEKAGNVLPPEALRAIREQVYGIVDA